LFDSFSKEDLIIILNETSFEINNYRKDQVIHLQSEVCESMGVILKGKVAIQKIDDEGNILTINIFSAPEIIGAHLIFSAHNVYPMTVVADSNVVIMRFKKDLLIRLGRDNPEFMVALLQVISDRTIILADKIRSISYQTIRNQITAFLVYEYHSQKSQVIKLRYSKKELAERFGVQRTSLSRELHKMHCAGLLDYDARTITIKDLDLIAKAKGP